MIFFFFIFSIKKPNMRKPFSLVFFFFPNYSPGTKHNLKITLLSMVSALPVCIAGEEMKYVCNLENRFPIMNAEKCFLGTCQNAALFGLNICLLLVSNNTLISYYCSIFAHHSVSCFHLSGLLALRT